MIITPFKMYWILMLDSIGCAACIAAMVFAVSFVVHVNEGSARKDRIAKLSAAAAVLFAIIAIFIPTTKQVAMMYAVPAIINNEDVQAMPADLVKLARQEIDKMLKWEEDHK